MDVRELDLTDELDLTNTVSIGVMSDTHGVVSDSVRHTLDGCHLVLHAGDICGQNVLDELDQFCPRVIAVGGNNDGGFTYAESKLPDVVNVMIAGQTISLLHGHQFGMARPSHDDMRRAFAQSRAIIYGHTHKQVHETLANPWVLNPGAAGDTRTNGGASCAVIAITGGDWKVSLHRN